jgi:hypothetical protein
MGLGGGIIKRHTAYAILLVLGMVLCIFPSVGGAENQIASDDSAKIGLNGDIKPLEVDAASKYKKTKKYKKYKTSTYKKYKKYKTSTYKKYKKAAYKKSYTYKKIKTKVRYKYKGKWRYKTVYKYKKVRAAYSYKKTTYQSYTNPSDWKNDPKLDSIMESGSKYGYSHAYHTGEELVEHGSGDCWAMSDYLDTEFKKAGYNSRVIQYATSYSSKHRSVQVNINGKWQKAPYRTYGYNYLFV